MKGYFTQEELIQFGFKSLGTNVQISTKASLYDTNKMIIGSNVRIDDFALLIGNVEIHDFVHIGAYCGLHASQSGKIVFDDFSGISSNVTIYASSDLFDGEAMTARPGLPSTCTKAICTTVHLEKYSQVGTGSTILPNGSIGEGTAVGAMSLVNKPLEPWYIYFGIPCKKIKKRSSKMLKLIEEHLNTQASKGK